MTDQRPPRFTREQLAAADFEALMLDPKFKRFLFTVLDTSGMYAGSFHSDGRIHAMREGRRSLGLDLLRTAERYAGMSAHLHILAEEAKAQQETVHAHAKSSFVDDRHAELGGPALREPGTGLTYLEYPADTG